MCAMTKLFFEDFSEFDLGPLPVDCTAMGEYHHQPTPVGMGRWHSPMRGHWKAQAPWLVFEDDGRRRLLQTIPAGDKWPRILVAGESWRNYTLEVRLQPLRADGFVGVCFRYRTSRSHYRVGLDGGNSLKLIRVDHDRHDVLAEKPFDYSIDRTYELKIEVKDSHIVVAVGRKMQFAVEDETFPEGRIGLAAMTTCIYNSADVSGPRSVLTALVKTRDEERCKLDDLCGQYPNPVLWKQIDTQGYGTGRQIRFGHLKNRDRLDILLAQNMKLAPGTDRLTTVRCLTAIDLDGNIIWQFGEPSGEPDAGLVTCDLPVQIYDIDGDGRNEVLCLKNFKLYILDGRTGKVKRMRRLPLNPREENSFGRLVGDAIVIANLRGEDRPSDIIVKNRYRQIWAFDNKLDLLWTREFPTWQTGHFAQPFDFDGCGRDELFIGYCLLGPDGEVRWSHDWPDHTDEIAIGPFDEERGGVQIAIAAGEAGFNILAPDGEVLYREMLGHAQRLSAAKFRHDLPGLQFYVITYWGHAGIISFHDCRGKRLHDLEPTSLGNVLNPVNWAGDETELALLSGSSAHG